MMCSGIGFGRGCVLVGGQSQHRLHQRKAPTPNSRCLQRGPRWRRTSSRDGETWTITREDTSSWLTYRILYKHGQCHNQNTSLNFKRKTQPFHRNPSHHPRHYLEIATPPEHRSSQIEMSPSALPAQRVYRIASMGADGIGPEVIEAGVEVLKALADTLGTFELDFTDYDWSSETYKKTGKYIPDGGLEQLKKHDAILFGAVGAPDVPDHISLWGLRLAICQSFQQYANVRPTRVLRGTQSPLRNCAEGDLDWVIIRENSEGEYAGQGGRSHRGLPWETATEVSIFTRHGVERLIRFAFETARSRPRKLLTFVTKSNAQRNGMVLWDEVVYEVAKDFPDITLDKMLVDAMTTRMVLDPKSLDTIVATNLHADILSDLAAALAGSIGIAPTSNLDPTRGNPSMFEPIHGSAFDITGKGVANPVATFWTAAEMLEWLGEKGAAAQLMECVESVTGRGIMTADLGGKATTKEVTAAVVGEIQATLRRGKA
ncbi:tartrate dehydrogenase [Colletotrichum graminicola]|nr:tartrate dehydrogenase [Colletotrichum graminicola]